MARDGSKPWRSSCLSRRSGAGIGAPWGTAVQVVSLTDNGALSITSDYLQEILVVSLRGRLTTEAGAEFLDWLATAPRVIPHVVLNVAAITSIDPGGAEALLDAVVSTSLRDGTLAITNLTTRLREAMHRCGVLPMVESFADDGVAVAALRSRGASRAIPARVSSLGDIALLNRPSNLSSFEFIRIASLRTAQLMRGCAPLVPQGTKPATTAMREVAAGKVRATGRRQTLSEGREERAKEDRR